jgi:hypothetical protein
MKTNKRHIAVLSALAIAGATTVAEAASIQLNGQPLQTSVAPIMHRGRTLVPMRDIFEALGAEVQWDSYTRSITATRAATTVKMQMGRSNAWLNGHSIPLDQPPMVVNNRTMVPLRFVSEALGANVSWNNRLQLVAINTGGTPVAGNNGNSGTAVAGVRTISVPAGVVVAVTLDQDVNSATARVGDTVTASVKSERLGDSEFPGGSKVEGVVTEAKPRTGAEPGVLDLQFRSVLLPDGSRVPINGQLIALDSDSVINGNGRIVAPASKGGGNKLKVIGIGAGVGYVIGKVLLKKDGLLSGVLGAAGGYLYDASKNKGGRTADARLAAGTALGVRLNNGVAYRDTTGYAANREQVLGVRLQ